MRKINIGAGANWREEGWDVLDNGSADYKEPWKHKGKCWDSNLPDDIYDIVFTSHMLEHVPHYRTEKTIAEFNRIMKTGGKLRILVPSLKKYAQAYVDGDESYFSGSRHYSDHLGIGGSFMRIMISPGQQTIAMSREMDEIFGGYAHLYHFDFEMMRRLLEKWGFSHIVESEPGQSSSVELQTFQHIVHDGKIHNKSEQFVEDNEYMKTGRPWHIGGFDKNSPRQLVVEAVKAKTVQYSLEKEYEYNKANRFGGPLDNLKLTIFRVISSAIDGLYAIAKKFRILNIVKAIRR